MPLLVIGINSVSYKHTTAKMLDLENSMTLDEISFHKNQSFSKMSNFGLITLIKIYMSMFQMSKYFKFLTCIFFRKNNSCAN